MKHSKEFKIGIFVVTVLVASFFLINYLRGEDIFNNEIELISRYDDVEGLVASAPVYIKGIRLVRWLRSCTNRLRTISR